ncbi:MAG: NAD(P)-dependent oxidoreductase [Acidobacteriota bacterium]|nr:NAD(P)-dependent oxidoreductase [Acidobacteriota bacterium]MDW3229160.1 NAD(P)-dependent oxidoreductase [Acidobacteriota bacterium]MDY0231612.1 NAD(P)-dependent oxidoreductase [Candidatus Saccharicenans sp.]
MDVYFYEVFEEEAKLIKSLIQDRLDFGLTGRTIQESRHQEPPAKLISVRTQSIIPPEWQSQLDGVLSRTTGFDNLRVYKNGLKAPVVLGYLEEYATRAVAEQAILLILSLMRKLPRQIEQFSRFNRDGLTGNECLGKKLLIVGVGRIGGEIARIGLGLGMEVRGVDIVRRHDFVTYIDKEEGLGWAEVIICAMNLTDENFHYFSYKLLRKTKPGVIFVNIARGEHVSLNSLLQLMQEGHLGGVGLDVFEDEPEIGTALRTNQIEASEKAKMIKELLSYPNVILTPHNAFNTTEALKRKVQYSLDEIFYFLKNRTFHNKV